MYEHAFNDPVLRQIFASAILLVLDDVVQLTLVLVGEASTDSCRKTVS
jgi:hypothetical protein